MIKYIYCVIVATGPLRGSHDADVAHGENEFDTPDLGCLSLFQNIEVKKDRFRHFGR